MSKIHHRKHIEEDENWLITYADMITLLMAFFVILVAMSSPNSGSMQKMKESLKAAGFIKEATEDPFEVILEQLQILIEDNALEKQISVEETDRGVMLELSSSSFYEPGSAKFKAEAIPILEYVAAVLRDFDYDAYVIEVAGHTDDTPTSTPVYPSNWELSGARASNVVRFFIASGLNQELMKAAGFADVKPKVPNLDPNGNPIPENRELNRRVVINVERVER